MANLRASGIAGLACAALFTAIAQAAPVLPPAATEDTGPKVGYENFEAPGVFTTTVQSNGNTTEWTGRGAGEPSIGVNWKTATAANPGGVTNFQSDLQTLFVTFNDGCPAGGKKAAFANRPAPTSQGVDSDPIGFTDRTTGRTFAGELTLLSPTCKISYTDDDGVTWVPTSGPNGAAVDHQTIAGGPYHLIAGQRPPYAKPAPAYDQALYYCSQDLEAAYCMRSDDGGVSWQQSGTPNFTPANCGSYLHGHVKVAPTSGTVYLPNKNCGGVGSVAISTDNGATWTISKVQSAAYTVRSSGSDPVVAIDTAGKAYFAIASDDKLLSVATTNDEGLTWQNFADVTSALGLKSIRFPAAIGGEAGRAAIAFFGSTTSANPSSSGFVGSWHLYIAHTFDGGASWSVSDATPDIGMQRGCIWGGGGGTICRNMLDFIDAAIDKQGRVQVGYVNGCPGGACALAPPTSKGNDYSATTTIARQSSGRRMVSAFDPANAATATALPGIPKLVVRRIGAIAHLAWSEGDTGNSPLSGFQILRSTATGAEIPIAQVGPGVRVYDDLTASDPTKTYFYEVIAQNGVGSSCGNNEVAAPYMGDSCPGLAIHQNDPAHQESAQVQNGVNANLAIDYISVAEPTANLTGGGTGNLVFTMKVGTLATVPPNSRWRIVWNSYDAGLPQYNFNGDDPPPELFFVGMRSGPSGAVTFNYGTVGDAGLPAVLVLSEDNVKTASAGSGYNADGTITVVVPKAGVGNPAVGDLLGAIGGKTFTSDAGAAGNYERSTALIDHTFVKGVTDNSFPATAYLMREASHVTANQAPVATIAANPVYGNPGMTVTFSATGADLADGDVMGSVRYHFGDGTADVTRSCGAFPTPTLACFTTPHAYANPGFFTASVVVIDSCGTESPAVTVEIHVNAPPVANAGADFSIDENTSGMLSGALSSDPDGDALSYAWTQTAGPATTLTSADTATPSFVAPSVIADTPLTFQLKVTDIPLGLTRTDTVVVTVNNVNLNPVANAGADFAVDERTMATLDGSASADPRNSALTYAWTQTAGPAVALSSASATSPTFAAPPVAADTTLSFTLNVTNAEGLQAVPDSVTVTVRDINLAPIARAGSDRTVDEKTVVRLDGSLSGDPDGDAVTFAWSQVGGPAVTLAGATSATPSFRAPDVSGDGPVTLRLTVTDTHGLAAADDVTINVHDLDLIGDNGVGALPPLTLLLLGLLGLRRRQRSRN